MCRWNVLDSALIRRYPKKWKPDTKKRDVGLKRRKECAGLACSHRRTALRIKDAREAEPETPLGFRDVWHYLKSNSLLTQGLND